MRVEDVEAFLLWVGPTVLELIVGGGVWTRNSPATGIDRDSGRALRVLPDMMSPLPMPAFGADLFICSTKFPQPPLLRPLFHDPFPL